LVVDVNGAITHHWEITNMTQAEFTKAVVHLIEMYFDGLFTKKDLVLNFYNLCQKLGE